MRGWLTAAFLCLLAAGCTHVRTGSVDRHFADFNIREPHGNTVYVCHAYGCKLQTHFRFTDQDIAALSRLMKTTRKDGSAAEERRAIAYAIGWMERRTGDVIGTKSDRPGFDFMGPGDPTQQDCVDEASNSTSYLLVLANNKLLRHHTIGTPFAKENPLRGLAGWVHWTAVIRETATGQTWAVDSWVGANGENPAIVETEKWYISGLDKLPPGLR
ncbi:MAG: hypothetical protein AB7E81_14175 [Hyphomicrobiaceae bacterium]